MDLQAKGEFARAIGVSPGRISQMITEGIIGADALEGTGRGARIRVAVAKLQIAARRNPGQALGNGLTTRVHDVQPQAQPDRSPPALETLLTSDLPRQLQEERLEGERRKNRIAAREEALALGQLVPADQVRAELGRVLQEAANFNAGLITDFATAIAGEYGLPQRDLLHMLRRVSNEKRAELAERLRANAAATAAVTTTEIGEPA